MRILVISNLYPPYYVGGYELGCQDVVDRLQQRGQKVSVLTSTYGVERATTEGAVLRRLHLHWWPPYPPQSRLRFLQMEYEDNAALREIISITRPEIIYIWNMGGLSRSLLITAQRCGVPIAYDVFDHWLKDICNDAWLMYWRNLPVNYMKRVVKKIAKYLLSHLVPVEFEALNLQHVCFRSALLKEESLQRELPVEEARIIYHGIDTKLFTPSLETQHNGLRLLYAGQLVQEKGVHTAIEALSILVDEMEHNNVQLSMAGAALSEEYLKSLQDLIAQNSLTESVRFLGRVPRCSMVEVYCDHDVLIFPSIWVEPFGLSILEAMACGLAVVSTVTGGNREFLIDGENALLFPPGDADALALQIERLIRDPDLRQRISAAGQKLVRTRFDIETMVDKIEEFLKEAISEKGSSR